MVLSLCRSSIMLETTKERTTKGVDHEPGSRTDLQPPTLAGAPVLRTRTRRRRRTRKMIRIRRRRQGHKTNETIPESWILRKRSSNAVAQGHRRPRVTTSARRLHGYDIMVSAAVVNQKNGNVNDNDNRYSDCNCYSSRGQGLRGTERYYIWSLPNQ